MMFVICTHSWAVDLNVPGKRGHCDELYKHQATTERTSLWSLTGSPSSGAEHLWSPLPTGLKVLKHFLTAIKENSTACRRTSPARVNISSTPFNLLTDPKNKPANPEDAETAGGSICLPATPLQRQGFSESKLVAQHSPCPQVRLPVAAVEAYELSACV